MKQEFVPFKIHPRIFAEIGERLVTDDYVAIAELVKNSYDAMAKNVRVIFNAEGDQNVIIIEDDGHGMSFELLRDVWTVLFTPYKENIKKESLGKRRTPSGDKGIGRLAAARLGTSLQITTQQHNSACYSLQLNWDDLTQIKDINESGVLIENVGSSGNFSKRQGTRIRI